MADCLFCKIVAGTIPSKKVHDDERCVAFHDISPQAPLHVLIVPRAHLESTAALEAEHRELAGHLVLTAAALARAHGVEASGYRLVMNTGRDGGQSVAHLHLHLLGGRGLGWPPG